VDLNKYIKVNYHEHNKHTTKLSLLSSCRRQVAAVETSATEVLEATNNKVYRSRPYRERNYNTKTKTIAKTKTTDAKPIPRFATVEDRKE